MMTHHYKNEGPKLFQTDWQTEWQRQTQTDHQGGGGQLWSPVDFLFQYLIIHLYVLCVGVCGYMRLCVRMWGVWRCVRMWGWLGCMSVRMCECMRVCIVIWGCPLHVWRHALYVWGHVLWSWILTVEVLKAERTAFYSRLTHGYTIEPTHLPHLTLLLMQNLGHCQKWHHKV